MFYKLTMRLAILASAALIASSAVGASAEIDEGGDQIINKPAAQMNWEMTGEGVQFAALQGDRFSEAYMAMVKLPAGLISPAHIKSANMYGLVLSGTITHHAVDVGPDDEVALPAGSYYKIPAGLAHVSKCVSDVDCVTFLYQDGKFDFLPIGQ
ncbi:DUF4437 domain-containing protein [Pararhizobium sp. IMCC21322]|uniref:DUF4437 domain-containing protein n=1 Tax=Pararhizobium sp. IMCC21322 TaxID=3067903 RepID=UPI002740DB5B|nr:DUF4437 domain-containing protein [Pararhizobium sp. IMCC21322]